MGHLSSKLLRNASSDSMGITPCGVVVSEVDVPLICLSIVRAARAIFRMDAISLENEA